MIINERKLRRVVRQALLEQNSQFDWENKNERTAFNESFYDTGGIQAGLQKAKDYILSSKYDKVLKNAKFLKSDSERETFKNNVIKKMNDVKINFTLRELIPFYKDIEGATAFMTFQDLGDDISLAKIGKDGLYNVLEYDERMTQTPMLYLISDALYDDSQESGNSLKKVGERSTFHEAMHIEGFLANDMSRKVTGKTAFKSEIQDIIVSTVGEILNNPRIEDRDDKRQVALNRKEYYDPQTYEGIIEIREKIAELKKDGKLTQAVTDANTMSLKELKEKYGERYAYFLLMLDFKNHTPESLIKTMDKVAKFEQKSDTSFA